MITFNQTYLSTSSVSSLSFFSFWASWYCFTLASNTFLNLKICKCVHDFELELDLDGMCICKCILAVTFHVQQQHLFVIFSNICSLDKLRFFFMLAPPPPPPNIYFFYYVLLAPVLQCATLVNWELSGLGTRLHVRYIHSSTVQYTVDIIYRWLILAHTLRLNFNH